MTRPLTWRVAAVGAVAVLVLTVGFVVFRSLSESEPSVAWEPPPAAASPAASPPPPAFVGWSDPAKVGQAWGDKVPGLLTFRGNPTRSFYGVGPIPKTKPDLLWRYPKTGAMCAISVDETGPSNWCGTGWTGQPAVFERDGRTWVVFGAYDRNIHFLDAATGEQILPDFPTGDIIKGSVTIDPDGFPLVYSGSRDNYFRVIAMDRDKPTELWKLSAKAVSPTMWNDDWDSSALVIDDYLFEGGENSQFHIVKLNRAYGPDGKVTVNPKLVWNTPSWDAQLLKDTGHNTMSVENSVAIYKDVMYFANGGGLVQGWDISGLKAGKAPERVFRFWTGDDTDATIVIDEQGMLYVGSEYEKGNARSREVGQLMKLDPSKPDNPLVWKIDDHASKPAGTWSTPVLYKDLVVFATHNMQLIAVERATGAVRWKFVLPGMGHGSPVIVDDVLLAADCSVGDMHAFDMSNPNIAPPKLWNLNLNKGCIESTPAVWKGVFYIGTRAGGVHAVGLR